MSAPGATGTAPADGPGSPDPVDLLLTGEVELKGRMPWSSNATFLVSCGVDGAATLGVYKPGRGERPLWDFPPGLYHREIAARVLSEALGWGLVPPTVLRHDAPLGPGSVQLFVAADFEQHYFTLYEDEAHHDALRTICLFDLLIANSDRKSGHCLLDEHGHIWAIDNGLSFPVDDKLRTVIWEFGGEPVPPGRLDDVARMAERGLPGGLRALLGDDEREAVLARARQLLDRPCFPVDATGRRYPWPLV